MKYTPLDETAFQDRLRQMKADCVESRFMKAYIIKGISIESGKIAENERTLPLIKLVMPLEQKHQYQNSVVESTWSMMSDRDEHTIVLFLDMSFRGVAKPLKIYMMLDAILTSVKDKAVVNILDRESVRRAMEKEEKLGIYEVNSDSVEGLNWISELIKSRGEAVIGDGNEPDVGVDSIPLDVPTIIMELYAGAIYR